LTAVAGLARLSGGRRWRERARGIIRRTPITLLSGIATKALSGRRSYSGCSAARLESCHFGKPLAHLGG
jgi:hypothetical protein